MLCLKLSGVEVTTDENGNNLNVNEKMSNVQADFVKLFSQFFHHHRSINLINMSPKYNLQISGYCQLSRSLNV